MYCVVLLIVHYEFCVVHLLGVHLLLSMQLFKDYDTKEKNSGRDILRKGQESKS
jgi:hypothetical protein